MANLILRLVRVACAGVLGPAHDGQEGAAGPGLRGHYEVLPGQHPQKAQVSSRTRAYMKTPFPSHYCSISVQIRGARQELDEDGCEYQDQEPGQVREGLAEDEGSREAGGRPSDQVASQILWPLFHA